MVITPILPTFPWLSDQVADFLEALEIETWAIWSRLNFVAVLVQLVNGCLGGLLNPRRMPTGLAPATTFFIPSYRWLGPNSGRGRTVTSDVVGL